MRIFEPLSSILLAAALPYVVAAQGPNISGTWISESDAASKLVISQRPEAIHVEEINAGKTESDFTCALGGSACEVKENRRSEKIMMYFNGGKLVEIRERGGVAFKEWLTVSADGGTLTVESVPLSSSQRKTKILFRRQSGLTS